MTAKEVIEILKESSLWPTLAPNEKQAAVAHALKIVQITEENIRNTVGEVYLD